MVIKWIQSRNQSVEAQAANQADEKARKLRRDSKLVDVAHEAMKESSAADRDTLGTLIKLGWPHVAREQFKTKVRGKVWDIVGENFGLKDTDIVEEITERITDVAEADSYYKRIFGKEGT